MAKKSDSLKTKRSPRKTSAKQKPAAEKKTGHVNLRTLAAYLDLSQTTVSLVLNDSPAAKSIPQETQQRVMDAARELKYRPNYFARSLRKSRSMSVGVIAPDLSEGYFTLVMSGVEQYLIRSHYFYFTASHYWHPDLIAEYPRMLLERAVDGFLLLNTPVEFEQSSVPVVAISAHRKVAGVTNIVLDHNRAAALALRYLYELGHRRIAFMRGPECIVDSDFRWSGIIAVSRELGLPVLPELTTRLSMSSFSPELGYLPMKEMLSRNLDFTAVFCFNDIAAIGAIRAIQDAGLRVPEDISVIGFDDIVSAAYYRPSLTTVRQPLREMGTTGAELLLERIAHPEKPYPSEIVMQPELIVRESTGPAAENARRS
ncbi:MAG TPA: LacI family DNA-binding transcriptional regulator [Acidisarcina sp.]|nr:LacI family DNA-binding transcriptional regulator [Acidisarcina sp.]